MTRRAKEPCPFCCSPRTKLSKQQHYGLWHWVTCEECGARGPRCDTQSRSIAEWVDMRGAERKNVRSAVVLPFIKPEKQE